MERDPELEEYILGHIAPEPEHLKRLGRHTQLHHLYGHQCSGHLLGRTLSMISAMVAPSRVIELGCFTGYSTLCLAEGLRPDGQLHTVEINDEDADELSERFASDPRMSWNSDERSRRFRKTGILKIMWSIMCPAV